MKKLKLDLDKLAVESFAVNGQSDAPERTVYAHEEGEQETIYAVTCQNAGETCGAFCVQNTNSLQPGQGCGGYYQTRYAPCGTGVLTCFQYTGCPGETVQTNCAQYTCHGGMGVTGC